MLKMFNILFFINETYWQENLSIVTENLYYYNEGSGKIMNFYNINWWKEYMEPKKNDTMLAMISTKRTNSLRFQRELWKEFMNHYGLKKKFIMWHNVYDAYTSVVLNLSDICLHPVASRTMKDSLMPHFKIDYAIYYKINEFHVSSTFFLEGLTFELWMYCVLTFVGLFLGFMILAKAYNYYLKLKNSATKVALYQANFICNQAVSDYLDKFLSWRILVITGFMFNCIFMVAFTAKFITNMSIKHFDQPFNELEDFARLRSHTLCLNPILDPIKYFQTDQKTDAKWEGVLNPPICATVYKDYYKSICEIDNIAALIPEVDFIDKKMNCTVMELSGPDYIPSSYGQLLVSRSFKYKEHANRFYLRMREVGIMKRLSQKYKELKDPLINFIDHYNERYVVEQDGVMFEHVKLIIITYFAFLPIPLIVLLMEILIHKYKFRVLRMVNQLAHN